MASKRGKGKPAPGEKADSLKLVRDYRGSLGLPEGEADQGMRAIEPLDTSETPHTLGGGEELASTDSGGMSAVEPFLREGEFPPTPGLPVEEISLPDAHSSMRGAPLFTADAFMLPEPLEKGLGYRIIAFFRRLLRRKVSK